MDLGSWDCEKKDNLLWLKIDLQQKMYYNM